jgi:hypothetical protein
MANRESDNTGGWDLPSNFEMPTAREIELDLALGSFSWQSLLTGDEATAVPDDGRRHEPAAFWSVDRRSVAGRPPAHVAPQPVGKVPAGGRAGGPLAGMRRSQWRPASTSRSRGRGMPA